MPYDFSLLSKFVNQQYHCEVFNLCDEAQRLAYQKLRTDLLVNGELVDIVVNERHYNEKTGDIIINIDWISAEKINISPYEEKGQGIII